jgi:hypothetical protein
MRRIKASERARGGNRGGTGGGYEHTDPDYEANRIQRMKAEYLSLDNGWRETYFRGLTPGDQRCLMEALKPLTI